MSGNVDWSVIGETGVMDMAQKAVSKVKGKHPGCDEDDLLQELLIILAQNAATVRAYRFQEEEGHLAVWMYSRLREKYARAEQKYHDRTVPSGLEI